jgi:transcriptional regulator with XRE-family HTH domain
MFSDWLKKKRKLMNLTQKEFASLCGISRDRVNLYENNLAKPTQPDMIRKLAKTLNVKETTIVRMLRKDK